MLAKEQDDGLESRRVRGAVDCFLVERRGDDKAGIQCAPGRAERQLYANTRRNQPPRPPLKQAARRPHITEQIGSL